MTSLVTTLTWKPHALSSDHLHVSAHCSPSVSPDYKLHPAPSLLRFILNTSPTEWSHWHSLTDGDQPVPASGRLDFICSVHHYMHLQWQNQNTELYWSQTYASMYFPLEAMSVRYASTDNYNKQREIRPKFYFALHRNYLIQISCKYHTYYVVLKVEKIKGKELLSTRQITQ